MAEQEPARQRRLAPELNNIVSMAMRKEPARRYSSVEQFSEDIRRYLEQRPIIARKDTVAYRARKFVRRNKLPVAAAILVLLALAAGMVATSWQARIANTERARAERRFHDVRKLANSNLFDVYPEIENLAGSLKAREKILRNALTYLDSLAQEATGDAELQSELATAYEKVGDVQGALNTSSLGQVQAGLDSYGKAARLRRAVLADHPGDLTAKKQLANNIYVTARTLWNNSQTAEAETAFAETIRLQRELIAAQPDAAELKNRLAVTLIDYGASPVFNFQTAKAIPLFDEGLAIIQSLRQKNPDDAELQKTRARGLRILSKARAALGDHASGLEALQEAHALSRELGRQFPQDFRLQRSVWLTETMICELFIDQGDGAEAMRNCERTIEFRGSLCKTSPITAWWLLIWRSRISTTPGPIAWPPISRPPSRRRRRRSA
ncbi:hypothetical protein BH20VER1_BH20VER1_19540 [soil metagenome]